ncbi:uncharacterized protein [Dermacentor andersoni]|uniref:uncharacterized protein isoform X3 n=1 Tax=Dermacentor andersoni TaxID=34620 RepID=UPI003B3A0008
MAEKRSNVYTPPVFSFTDEATPSARRDDTQDVSSTLRAYTTTSEDAWPYQWITQQQPIMDGTKNVDSVTDNGGTSCLPLWSRRSIDRTRPSGSCVGMVQASPNIKGGTTIPGTTSADQWNTQYPTTDGTSGVSGHTDNPENRSTSFPLPVYSSSSAGSDNAVASTSRAGMEEASGALGKEAR